MTTALALPEKSLVEQAFELAVPTPKVEGVAEELDSLLQVRGSFLPIEERARLVVDARISELNTHLKRSKFPEARLPLEPLGWRWRSGLPKLALLSLGSPHFTITAGQDYWGVTPQLPDPLLAMYRDVGGLAKSHCFRPSSSCEFSYTFDGVIPAETRVRVAEAMTARRFDSLWMLVETPEKAWTTKIKKGQSRREQVREAMASFQVDPLILGWQEGALWVIDKFDLTTLEDYVLTEFTQKELPAPKKIFRGR